MKESLFVRSFSRENHPKYFATPYTRVGVFSLQGLH